MTHCLQNLRSILAAPSWCGMSSCAAIFTVFVSNFPKALSPSPRTSMCLSTSSIGILPHHKWFNFPWFVVGGVVVGRPVPLFKHHVLKKVAVLMFFDRSFKDAFLYAAIAGASNFCVIIYFDPVC